MLELTLEEDWDDIGRGCSWHWRRMDVTLEDGGVDRVGAWSWHCKKTELTLEEEGSDIEGGWSWHWRRVELTLEENGADICGGYRADIGKRWSWSLPFLVAASLSTASASVTILFFRSLITISCVVSAHRAATGNWFSLCFFVFFLLNWLQRVGRIQH